MATRAVIDIGTNSAKLLVAEVQGGNVAPVYESSEQTRLGAGFYETHVLGAEAIAKTADAVRIFIAKASRYEPVSICVLATSAARDAKNQADLIGAIRAETGLELEVISGDQEAEWAFTGVASDPALGDKTLLVMDVGGGSTEFVLGANGKRRAGRSFQLGTVRLMEKFPHSDPPSVEEREQCLGWLRHFFATEIAPFLKEHLADVSPVLVSTGGTASILGRLKWKLPRYDRKRIEGTVLGALELAATTKDLWALPLEPRKHLPGMPASRADVIIMGAAILEAATEALGFSEVRVSTRGLRYGALLRAEHGHQN